MNKEIEDILVDCQHLLSVIVRIGGLAQGGEQDGNLVHCEDVLEKLNKILS